MHNISSSTCSRRPGIGRSGRSVVVKSVAAAGAGVENAHEEFVAVATDATVARLLAVKRGDSLFLRTHTVLDSGGRPMEIAEVYYVSSRFALTLELRRGEERKL